MPDHKKIDCVTKRFPTGHEVQKKRRDGIDGRAVCDVWTGESQHTDDPVRHTAALTRQVIAESVGRVHERRQQDRFLRQLCK